MALLILTIDNAGEKLATTSTGIDVTGTVTADGLTVDGLAEISAQTNGAYALRVGDAAGSSGSVAGIGKIGINPQGAGTFTYTGAEIRAVENSLGDYRARLTFHTRGNTSDVEPLERLRIENNGDISFYEDTGTTAKMFWDASAESLFIGATSASALNTFSDDLIVSNTAAGTGAGISIVSNATNGYSNIHFGDTDDADIGRIQYNNATNKMTFRTNTSDALTIDSSQNVGIGTSSPSEALTVSGNIQIEDNDGYLQFKDTNGGTNNKFRRIYNSAQSLFISRRNDDETLEANDLVIDASGNVGIGTSTPSAPLNVVAGSNANAIRMNGRSSDNYSEFYASSNDGSTNYSFLQGHSAQTKLYTLTSTPLLLGTNSTERMRIDSSGLVGIGTSAMSSYNANWNDLLMAVLAQA